MKKLLFVMSLVIAQASAAEAYNVTVSEPAAPYEVIDLGVYTPDQSLHLGKLQNYPLMYEFVLDNTAEFKASLVQRYTNGQPIPLSLILVRQNEADGGVREVARLNPETNDWQTKKRAVLGLTLWRGPELSESLQPGTYRLEVSTPDNQGRYGLEIGSDSTELGYFATLKNVRTTQRFFDYSVVRMLTSSYIYYPLGVLFVLLLLQQTWKYRKSITHVN